jgi:hypothetical protein
VTAADARAPEPPEPPKGKVEAFDLYIVFVGMCLYVGAPTDVDVEDQTHMHVLMPRTTHEPHVAWFVTHPQFVAPDETSGSQVDIGNSAIEIATTLPAAIDTKLKARKLPNLAKIARSRVRPKLLKDDGSSGRLFARVTLEAGSACYYFPGAVWDLQGSRELTNCIIWKISGLTVDRIKWKSTSADPQKRPPALVPKPVGGKPGIVVGIFHIAKADLQRVAADGDGAEADGPPDDGLAHHYEALYTLFKDPDVRPLPRYVLGPLDDVHKGPPPCHETLSPEKLLKELPGLFGARSVSVYTCMSGGGGP